MPLTHHSDDFLASKKKKKKKKSNKKQTNKHPPPKKKTTNKTTKTKTKQNKKKSTSTTTKPHPSHNPLLQTLKCRHTPRPVAKCTSRQSGQRTCRTVGGTAAEQAARGQGRRAADRERESWWLGPTVTDCRQRRHGVGRERICAVRTCK